MDATVFFGTVAIFVVLFLLTRRRYFTLHSALSLIQSGDSLRCFESKENTKDVAVIGITYLLQNKQTQIIYWRTLRNDKKVVETMDMQLRGYFGGAVMTFLDGELTKLTKNGVHIHPSALYQWRNTAEIILQRARAVLPVGHAQGMLVRH